MTTAEIHTFICTNDLVDERIVFKLSKPLENIYKVRKRHMHKYTKAVLTVIALAVLFSPVKAKEKVYYCEMTGLAKTTIERDRLYKPEKFKFMVSPEEVVFGSGGYMNNTKKPISRWFWFDMFQANFDGGSLLFSRPEFHYTSATYSDAIAFSAHCDDF